MHLLCIVETKTTAFQEETQSRDSNHGTLTPSSHSKYAYMFLIGGIDPSTPGYRGFLYNVMIATYLLRAHGSKSDIILFLQMDANATMDTILDKEEKELRDLGIKFRYMEKPEHQGFAHIVMEKFQILTLTEYERVTYLDADILPVINLDYYMDLSVQGVFQPNYVVATKGEPSNGGLFMISPQEGDYEALQTIIHNQKESVKELGYPWWNKTDGWGHSFLEEGDMWEGTKKAGSKWGFWGAQSDQGLLYYWTKYYRKSVTIFRGNVVENWINGTNGKPMKNETLDPVNITQLYAPQSRSAILHNCHRRQAADNYNCKMPYQDHMHYTGKQKPWQQGYSAIRLGSPGQDWWYDLWFNSLFNASAEFGWNITDENVNDHLQAHSPLGYTPSFSNRAKIFEK